jgi:hypothetical protein
MEAMCSSETSVDFRQITLSYMLEDINLRKHSCENLKSCTEARCINYSIHLKNYYYYSFYDSTALRWALAGFSAS